MSLNLSMSLHKCNTKNDALCSNFTRQIVSGFERRKPGRVEEAFHLHATFSPPHRCDVIGRTMPVRATCAKSWFLMPDRLRDALRHLDLDVRDEAAVEGIFFTLDYKDNVGINADEFKCAVKVDSEFRAEYADLFAGGLIGRMVAIQTLLQSLSRSATTHRENNRRIQR